MANPASTLPTLLLLAWLIPLLSFVAIVFGGKRMGPHGKYAGTVASAAIITSFLLIGFLLYPVIMIGNIVFCILAGIKANEGVSYRYPVSIRLIG